MPYSSRASHPKRPSFVNFRERNRLSAFGNTRFSLTNAIEVFLDPLLAVATLLSVAIWFNEPIDAHYVVLSLIVFSLTYPGTLQFSNTRRRMMRKTMLNWFVVAVILVGFGYASGYERFYPDTLIIGWSLGTPIMLLFGHEVARQLVPKVISRGSQHRAIIVGGNEIGAMLANQFVRYEHLGVKFVGFFDDRTRDRLGAINDLPLLGSLKQLASYTKEHSIDHIYLALPMASQPRILALLDDLKDTTASIYFVPDIFVTDLIQGRMDSVDGMPVVAVCETPFTGVNGLIKRCSDLALASFILLLISPLLLACAIGVKLSSPGPIIFKQRRYGLDGKEILVYKFRSMTVTEDGAVVTQARKNDVRVTKFGAFIRKTSLDELPQFLNVLQGRMSIVGPRPHAVSHNEMYRKLIKGYMVRHKVKPGITGWAQVNGYRGETDTVDKMENRIRYDLEYLRNWSLNLDLWIVIKTVLLVARDSKAY